MNNQVIALLSHDGTVSWVNKEDFVNFAPEVKASFVKTAFFWKPSSAVPLTEYQRLAEKALAYNPFKGIVELEE